MEFEASELDLFSIFKATRIAKFRVEERVEQKYKVKSYNLYI